MHRFEEKSHVEMYGRLLNLAATSLAEVWFIIFSITVEYIHMYMYVIFMFSLFIYSYAHVLQTESEQGNSKFWEESYSQASLWKPCAEKKSLKGVVNPGVIPVA